MSVQITAGASTDDVSISLPRPVFEIHPRNAGASYDVTSDGQHFLVNELAEQNSSPALIIVNWDVGLR